MIGRRARHPSESSQSGTRATYIRAQRGSKVGQSVRQSVTHSLLTHSLTHSFTHSLTHLLRKDAAVVADRVDVGEVECDGRFEGGHLDDEQSAEQIADSR